MRARENCIFVFTGLSVMTTATTTPTMALMFGLECVNLKAGVLSVMNGECLGNECDV